MNTTPPLTGLQHSHRFFFLGFLRLVKKCACQILLSVFCPTNSVNSENPFDYELNNLGMLANTLTLVILLLITLPIDLDNFCLKIGRDLHEITAVSHAFMSHLYEFDRALMQPVFLPSTRLPIRIASSSANGTSPLHPPTVPMRRRSSMTTSIVITQAKRGHITYGERY